MSKAKTPEFGLDDFRMRITLMRQLASSHHVINGIYGIGSIAGFDVVDRELKRVQAIIDSMTPAERATPKIIEVQRRNRIAAGAGVRSADVSSVLKQFDAMASVVNQMASMSKADKFKMMLGMGKSGTFDPYPRLASTKQLSSKRLTSEEREELRKKQARSRPSSKDKASWLPIGKKLLSRLTKLPDWIVDANSLDDRSGLNSQPLRGHRR